MRHDVSRPGSATEKSTLTYYGVHLIRITHPRESERYAYDELGRMATRTVMRTGMHPKLSYTERYEYDAADRVSTEHLPEGGTLSYRWGRGRQLLAIEHDNGRASATSSLIKFNPASTNNPGAALASKPKDFSIGTVNMAAYLQWLRNNGYDLGSLKVQ